MAMHLTFDPDLEFNDPETLVLRGPRPNNEGGMFKIGRVFNRGAFYEGLIYGMDGRAISEDVEEVKRTMLEAMPKFYQAFEGKA